MNGKSRLIARGNEGETRGKRGNEGQPDLRDLFALWGGNCADQGRPPFFTLIFFRPRKRH
jgi:hypothetical protein